MKKVLLGTVMALGVAGAANAGPIQISAFSQTSNSNTVTATANGADTATSLSISNANVVISQLFGNATPISADFSLTAASTNAAQTSLGLVVQDYAGNFCMTSGPGCTGTNYLSGTFTDAAVGAAGGPGLVINVNNPPNTLALSSGVIPSSDLIAPNTFNLSFSNVVPSLGICGSTICGFGASFAGTVSANTTPVDEPAGIAVLGLGLLGLTMLRRKSGG